MKNNLMMVLLLFVFCANAQTKLEFGAPLNGSHAVPPNHSPWVAGAFFTLGDGVVMVPYGDGFQPVHNLLSCDVDFPTVNLLQDRGFYPGGAIVVFPGLHGKPASTLALTSVIFGVPSSLGHPAPVHFSGQFVLNGSQIAQLLLGKAYVTVLAINGGGQSVPSGDIRGQIRLTRKPSPAPIVPLRTGIFGFVDSFSARRVFSLIIISETNGNIFQVNTDSQGIFQVNLAPGKYVINVLSANGGVILEGVEVSVYPGGFSFVRLSRLSF